MKAYHAWGRDCVKRFHGMFAFAIVERDSGKAMIARDPFRHQAVLLRHEAARNIRFASTLPALLKGGGIDKAVDPVALHHYMSFHAVVPAAAHHRQGRAQAAAGHHPLFRAGWLV